MTRYPAALIGRTIEQFQIADDKMAVRLVLDGGEELIVRTDGDCCSHSWIEHIENHEAVIGSPITKAEDVPMPGGVRTEDGEIATYGFALETARGRCVWDYRNESNGYYGGNLAWPDEYFYGGVFGQNESKCNWKDIGRR